MSAHRFSSDVEEQLTKSKQRIAAHGEVFTPKSLVNEMLDTVAHEASRPDSRFLEPACGSGNFLVEIASRKLATVARKFRGSDFEHRHHALLALMSVYGIELLPDNVAECRSNLLNVFTGALTLTSADELVRAAQHVLELNIIQGDALTLTTGSGADIVFAEWAYLGAGKFQRRDFRFAHLTQRAEADSGLFMHLEDHEIFSPLSVHRPVTISELAT